jgi:hypothetical protein
MRTIQVKDVVIGLLALTGRAVAAGADWSDTSIGYRYGERFAEPFNQRHITKNIVNLTSASGYQYGKNYFNVDFLMSSAADPSAAGSGSGAHETYALYRHTLDLGKVSGKTLQFGPVRGLGVTAGFDVNSKTDAGYNSRKRMLVAGPTLMLAVPGFLEVSLLAMWESNAPHSTFTGKSTDRYRYDTHAMLSAVWGIPFTLGAIPLAFEGFAQYIDAKGLNEFGRQSAAETNIDVKLMYDISPMVGAAKNRFRLGLQYQFWKNKFGNSDHGNPGATARTPMIRGEYHF